VSVAAALVVVAIISVVTIAAVYASVPVTKIVILDKTGKAVKTVEGKQPKLSFKKMAVTFAGDKKFKIPADGAIKLVTDGEIKDVDYKKTYDVKKNTILKQATKNVEQEVKETKQMTRGDAEAQNATIK
jgi:cytochrome c oxidase assembly protein Cox11